MTDLILEFVYFHTKVVTEDLISLFLFVLFERATIIPFNNIFFKFGPRGNKERNELAQ